MNASDIHPSKNISPADTLEEKPSTHPWYSCVIFKDNDSKISLIVDLSIVLESDARKVICYTWESTETSVFTVWVDMMHETSSIDADEKNIRIWTHEMSELMILGNIAIVLDSEVELKIFTPKFIKYKMKNQDENGLKQRYEKYLENGNVSRRIAFVQDEVNTQIE